MDAKKLYFKKPTQVQYYDYLGDFDESTPDEQKYATGIAYNGEIISAQYGVVIPIYEILRQAELDDFTTPIIINVWWEPLQIKG